MLVHKPEGDRVQAGHVCVYWTQNGSGNNDKALHSTGVQLAQQQWHQQEGTHDFTCNASVLLQRVVKCVPVFLDSTLYIINLYLIKIKLKCNETEMNK